MTLRHSLIGDGRGFDPSAALLALSDSNGNLIGDSILPIDPLLAPLANNGGPTQTHRLLPGSEAINAGDPATLAGQNGIPNFDQRGDGFSRLRGGRIDMGAFEVQNSRPMIVPPGTQFIDEGGSIDLSTLVSFSDPDLGDQHTATVDWGDGSGELPVLASAANGSGIIVATHTYLDNGSYLVTIRVSDGQDFDVKEFIVNVDNVSPEAEFNNNGPVLEGSAAAVIFRLDCRSWRIRSARRIPLRIRLRQRWNLRGWRWNLRRLWNHSVATHPVPALSPMDRGIARCGAGSSTRTVVSTTT